MSESTHTALHALVERYIRSVSEPDWPGPLREQGDAAVNLACQYGLGLIRMLAEYKVLEGHSDEQCIHLAVLLANACASARAALSDAPHSDPKAGHTKSPSSSRYPWRPPSATSGMRSGIRPKTRAR